MTDNVAHGASDSEGVLDELVRRERRFHLTRSGPPRADFEALTAQDFWEVGASGQCYGREIVWSFLQDRRPEPGDSPWEASDLAIRQLSADTYLLTYLLGQGERLTRRASIWQRTADGWQIVYHQGTVVSAVS